MGIYIIQLKSKASRSRRQDGFARLWEGLKYIVRYLSQLPFCSDSGRAPASSTRNRGSLFPPETLRGRWGKR
jgi:hypothetical protein